jgi:N6-L-threonylcarbamoyladenine synthase
VKTALLYTVRDLGETEVERKKADLAASYQGAIVRALTRRVHEAVERTRLEQVAVVGGVAANSGLRNALPEARFAPLALCTDNAAMIASAARFADALPFPEYLGLDAYASVA